ncbi:hypothetical protein EDB85DRAFT_1914686 [Lactarius pseudohatsudake]|nr:hypothetical protein EDB85DRAFT_1914686 [Lactarius pseudohatsudake]
MLMNKAGGSSVVRTQRRFRCPQETHRNHSARRARVVAAAVATRTQSHPAAGGVTASTPISIRLPRPLLLLGHAGTADAEVGAVAEVDADTDTRGLGARRPPCGCGKSRSDASFNPMTFFRPNPGGPRVASYWPVRSSLSSVLWEEEMGGRRTSRRLSRPCVGGW